MCVATCSRLPCRMLLLMLWLVGRWSWDEARIPSRRHVLPDRFVLHNGLHLIATSLGPHLASRVASVIHVARFLCSETMVRRYGLKGCVVPFRFCSCRLPIFVQAWGGPGSTLHDASDNACSVSFPGSKKMRSRPENKKRRFRRNQYECFRYSC